MLHLEQQHLGKHFEVITYIFDHHTNHPQPVDIKTISIRIEDPEMIHLLGG